MQAEISPTMKAIRVHAYGGPEVLRCEDVPRPMAGPGEVLIRAVAIGVNPPDWYKRSGYRDFPKEMLHLVPFPSLPFIPGSDVSGIVEEVGPGVSEFRPGQSVYGLVRFPARGVPAGTYAEYVVAPAEHLAPKPGTIDHLQAAAVPMSALTIWQALARYGRLEAGQTVLVNGAAGGLGHFAVQMAGIAGARVIGVASGYHEKFLRDLGVAEVIDYTTTAPEQVAHDVDLVIDTVGFSSGARSANLPAVLKPGGTLLALGASGYAAELEDSISVLRVQVHSDGKHLSEIAHLIDAGRLRIAIDMVVPLAEASRAHERAERGHLRGKIVLSAS